MKENKRLNIAAALNCNFVRYTYVMLISLFENQDEDVQIHIYLLQSELLESEKMCLENLVTSYGGYLHWLQIDLSYFPKSCTEFANWPVESFYRLALPELLPKEMERILYIDVDIIINHSLRDYIIQILKEMLCVPARNLFQELVCFRIGMRYLRNRQKKGFFISIPAYCS